MNLILINNSSETFTPTHSGAIATWLWECSQAAARAGVELPVISMQSEHASYEWPKTNFVNYPAPRGPISVFTKRLQRKLNGWRHMGQSQFARRVAATVRKFDGTSATLLLHNDPEMAVYLRRKFPRASVAHIFHNQEECKPGFRTAYEKAGILSIAVSDFTARWVETYYRLPPQSVATVYNGVDLTRFTPAQRPPSTKPVINFCGRTGIEKAPDLFLGAAIVLTEKTTQFDIQLLGANHWGYLEMDSYQRRLNDLVHILENRGITVRRPGHVPRAQVAEQMQKADIHVVPSRWDEPFGLTTLEGMACGLATVASRTGGTPEVVGDAGLLFQRDSVPELAAHLLHLIENPQLRADYANRARRRAETFSWDRTWRSLFAATVEEEAMQPEPQSGELAQVAQA